MDIKRGDIVYVEIPYATGHEMMKDRPAVVVSNDAMNYTAPVVSVVYLTGSKQADRPFHVEVWGAASARHGSSTALCEHIYTVDKSRLGKLMGTCSEEEMDAIEKGILLSLALGDGKYRAGQGIQVPPPRAGGAGRGRAGHRRRPAPGRAAGGRCNHFLHKGGVGDLQAALRRAA